MFSKSIVFLSVNHLLLLLLDFLLSRSTLGSVRIAGPKTNKVFPSKKLIYNCQTVKLQYDSNQVNHKSIFYPNLQYKSQKPHQSLFFKKNGEKATKISIIKIPSRNACRKVSHMLVQPEALVMMHGCTHESG